MRKPRSRDLPQKFQLMTELSGRDVDLSTRTFGVRLRSCAAASQGINKRLHIWRQRSFKRHQATGLRMLKRQSMCVKRQSPCATLVFNRRLIERRPVHRIAAYRIPQFRQMNADLMRSASLKLALNQRVIAESFDRSNMGDGPLPFGCVRRASA